MPHLERGTGNVGSVWQDLHRLLEHDPEGGGGAITLEHWVVAAYHLGGVHVDYLVGRGSFKTDSICPSSIE